MKTMETFHKETVHGQTAKLVAIADDITGAFDTGVQFSKRGASVKVVTGDHMVDAMMQADVLVIDAETRHLTPQEAYQKTRELAAWALERGATYFYVKTDSGLRGNIGVAIKAVLDATGILLAAFAPAYPDMNRITLNGQQFINGIPIQDSVFGQDEFEPVLAPTISGLIKPFGLDVMECPLDMGYDTVVTRPTVAVFDTRTNEDFSRIAAHLKAENQLTVTAGCAAFAAMLAGPLELPDCVKPAPVVIPPLLVICGSLNPITRKQMEYCEKMGGHRVVLSSDQLLDDGFLDSASGHSWIAGLLPAMRKHKTLLLDTGLRPLKTVGDIVEGEGLRKHEASLRIARQMGRVLERLLEMKESEAYTPMIIGGDTLMGYLALQEALDLELEGEVTTGVVAFRFKGKSHPIQMLSKSGGFGNVTLLSDVLSKDKMVR